MAHKPYFERTPNRIRILIWLFAVCAVFYFHWRINTLNPDAIIFSSLMLLAEVFGILTGIAHFMMTWRLTIRKSTVPIMNQSVDIFIPTFNESIDIVARTLSAALKMDYPHTTWLLDDGNRPEFKKLADQLGARYLARPTHEHAKAGNLNYGLAHATGQFIAIFDADHVPSKNFITAVLGYFSDPNVAFVQTPQDFYNLDSYQHRMDKDKGLVWTEQSLFFRVIQRGKDYWNAAFFCGSCAMVRRSCLDKIGGFATATITEDLHTSIKLHKCGYSSVYHEESLAFGIAPSTINPFITQRIRWGQGAMQVWKKEGIFFSKGLTIAQKINYAASILTYFDGWQKGFFYLAPIVVLCTGWLPIQTTGTQFLIHFLPYMILNFLLTEELARGYGRTIYIEQYNMARYFAFAYATLFLIIPKKLKFKVTNKGHIQDAGRYLLWPQKIVLYGNLLAIPFGILMLHLGILPFEGFIISFFWALFNAILAQSVLTFSKVKQAFRRSNYRFNLPNPVSLNINQNRTFAVADEISSDGCKIYGDLSNVIQKKSSINGEIYMPNANILINAKVKNIHKFLSPSNKEITVLSCEFLWEDNEKKRKLEEFFYGSGQEFNILRLSEKDFTPLEKIFGLLHLSEIQTRKNSPIKWLPILSNLNNPMGVIADSPDPITGSYNAILRIQPQETIIGAKIIEGITTRVVNLEIGSVEESRGFNYSYYLCGLKVSLLTSNV
jgi:cellulose synthase (UDP-forming)